MDGAPLDESVMRRIACGANTGSGMSMADDHTLGSYRSTDPQRRASEPARPNEQAGSGDPLAELARLIGQSDPFAEFGRSSARRTARQAQAQPQAASPAAAEQRYAPAQEQWHAPAPEQQFAADDAHGRDSYGADPYGAHADYAHPPAHAGEERLPAGHVHDEVPLAADHQGQYQHDDQLHQSQQYADEQQDGYDADQYYEDEASLDPHDEEMYDDPPPARGRSGLTTALALVGCALLGTVGAYAYRSYTGPAGSTQPPPVITADNSTPTKIVPATAGDPQSAKAVVVNAGKEQLVSKQEEPVALKEPAPQPAPRVAAPPPAAPAPQPSAAAATAANEPKKVRTVTIRPDGSDMSARPVGAPPPAPPPSAAAPAAPKAAAARSGGPISLDPQGGGEPASATAGRTQTAAAPPRPAPDATSNASGGFVVQLSSQKSESEALSAFRSLQAKFPNELGGRQPMIRRADLGSKGVFYRTLVGPFASAHEAGQFCSNYKAAGGQCVVPNN
jgi:SPOR domain